MFSSPTFWLVALAIFALNLPFGYWRAGLRKLSTLWFLAVHIPVLLGVGLRFAVHLPFHLATLPIFIAAFFAGQLVGGRLGRWRGRADRARG
jgi:hypothetical protein